MDLTVVLHRAGMKPDYGMQLRFPKKIVGKSMGAFMCLSIVLDVVVGLKFRGSGCCLLPVSFYGVICGPYPNVEMFVFFYSCIRLVL